MGTKKTFKEVLLDGFLGVSFVVALGFFVVGVFGSGPILGMTILNHLEYWSNLSEAMLYINTSIITTTTFVGGVGISLCIFLGMTKLYTNVIHKKK